MTHDLNDSTDEDLVALVTKGDHRAFSNLVKRHTDKFYALSFRTLGNTRDAEDVVQDCFVKLWKKPSAYKPERGAKFTTWFYRVVFNASIDLKRKHKIVVSDMDEALQDTNFTMQDERLIVEDEQVELEKAISTLPERQQAALNLCYYQEMPQKEAADIMGVGLKALESLLSRAKANLKDYYLSVEAEKKQVKYAAR